MFVLLQPKTKNNLKDNTMAKIKKMTLKHWGNDTHLISCENVTSTAAQKELNDFLATHPEYKEYPLWGIPQEAIGKDKIYVYAWYWRGAWADPTKEIYTRLYRVA